MSELKIRILAFFLLFLCQGSFAQPQALDTGIFVNEYFQAKGNSVRLLYNKLQDQFIYVTGDGNIYGLLENNQNEVIETALFDVSDHGVSFVQGMAIRDSLMVICGNINAFEETTMGRVAKAKLQPNGRWTWSTLAQTEAYESAGNFDHLFSGIVISPDGKDVIWCSGARGSHGEVQTYDGLYPGLRGLPITNILLKLPSNSLDLNIQNDSSWLANSGIIYAYGTRNFFDLEFNQEGKLYALENSGDRDDPEEMNEVIEGEHYGYPWTMGGNYNPMQFVPFDPEKDPLINPYCNAMKKGYFYEDPDFPQAPTINFKNPIKNYGPDADYYRDPNTGDVKKASDNRGFITTFSAHRSPLGIAFEDNSLKDPRYKNKGFMLSWTPGGDENGWRYNGNDTATGPFIDESEDLVMLSPRNGSFNEINSHRLVRNFRTPIDLVIARNKMYVLEYNYVDPKIYEISFSGQTDIKNYDLEAGIKLFPSPAKDFVNLEIEQPENIIAYSIINSLGQVMINEIDIKTAQKISLKDLANGNYLIHFISKSGTSFSKKLLIQH